MTADSEVGARVDYGQLGASGEKITRGPGEFLTCQVGKPLGRLTKGNEPWCRPVVEGSSEHTEEYEGDDE